MSSHKRSYSTNMAHHSNNDSTQTRIPVHSKISSMSSKKLGFGLRSSLDTSSQLIELKTNMIPPNHLDFCSKSELGSSAKILTNFKNARNARSHSKEGGKKVEYDEVVSKTKAMCEKFNNTKSR